MKCATIYCRSRRPKILLLPEFNKPYILDSLTAPIVAKYNWIFNAQHVDFMLQPIQYLEETTGAAIKIRVNGSEFWVPATWYILVTDRDTFQLDTIALPACATTKHIAFSFCPDEMSLRTLDIMVLDYADNMALVHPMITKGTALVHPVGPAVGSQNDKERQLSVVIGPFDLYKHLANVSAGDVFAY